jgi:hypothetical protein
MSNNGIKKQVKYDNNELFEVMREVGRELARSIRMKKLNPNKNEGKDLSVDKIEEHRKSVLDLILPENFDKEEKTKSINETKNDNLNVIVMGKRPSISMDYYSNLFEENNGNSKNVKTYSNKSFYERKKDAIEKKGKKLEKLRNIKLEEELKHIKIKPKMNKTSQKIMEKKKNEIKPIQDRVNEIVDKKYLKIDRLKQLYIDIENSHCSKVISNSHFDEKKFEEWLNRQMKWELEKKSKLENVKVENEKLENSMMKSMYRPTINRNSDLLVKSKVLNTEQNLKNKEECIYDKLYNMKDDKYNKMVKRLVETIPSFTPTINKNIPNYLKQNRNMNNPFSTQYSKYNTNANHTEKTKSKRLNRSVEEQNTFSVIKEENDEEQCVPMTIGNYVSSRSDYKQQGLNTSYRNDLHNHKGKVLNTFVTEQYKNSIHNYDSEIESHVESDFLTRYRKVLFDNKNINTLPKKMSENKSKAESISQSNIENSRDQSLNKIDLFDHNHFRMSIKNALAWEKEKENNIVNNQATNSKTKF